MKERREKETVQIFMCGGKSGFPVSDLLQVSSRACQHYSLITLKCSVPRRPVNTWQGFWSRARWHVAANNSQCFVSHLVNSKVLHNLEFQTQDFITKITFGGYSRMY